MKQFHFTYHILSTTTIAAMMISTKSVFIAITTIAPWLLVSVNGMAELTQEMMQARNLQELLTAEREHRQLKDQGRNMRSRKLQDQGLVDSEHILADMYDGVQGFYHGVASGDPLPDAVVVWTRYTPTSKEDVIELEFRMAAVSPELDFEAHLDPEANDALKRAKVTVAMESDFIAKIDVSGLDAGTNYVFAFSDGDKVSSVGQTKTAPGPDTVVESMVYAVFSCSHFSNGYFHSYDVASTIQDLDFWIHTGDYVYEYGTYASYATDVQERRDEILPEWEQISLQDYRNRMATYHTDEGLQNLRRRAPLIACWDDHEIANNPFGLGTSETSGAENHQEVCTANATSPDTEKDTAGCDRDEGDIVTRFNVAAQSYLEWMPIRRFPGNMGVVDIGSITQVVSWGDMATIVAIDTRVSHRSEDPTVNSNTWGSFFPLATAYTDVSQYTNESSPVFAEIREVAEGVHATLDSDEYTMIGEDIQILKDNFEASKSSGQTWQIWATATAMGRAMKGNYYDLDKLIEDPTTAAAVKAQTDAIFAGETSTFFRALSAEALTSTPWNRDDFSGFANEQRLILEALKETTTNPIILAGDLHDGYGWTLYEDGAIDGTPCAVNLVCPGVTSPGWGPFVYPAFSSLSETVGGDDALYSLLEEADEAANPGLKYYNHQYKGFMAVRATKESHVAEFYVHTPETVTSSYEVARAASGTIVAEYACDTQLTTTAGMPGSLDRADECSAITFESERPAVWDLPFPQVADAADLAELSDCGFAECKFATEPAPTSGATVVSGVSALLLLVAVVSTLSL